MAYKWKPNAAQRAEYQQRCIDNGGIRPVSAKEKKWREEKENHFKGGILMAVPTEMQHDFAIFKRPTSLTPKQEDAFNQVAYGYSCNEKIDHCYIHIVNQFIRGELI